MSVPPLVACAAAAALYALGGRGRVGSTSAARRRREAAFYLGVLVVLGALEPPLDPLADDSFAMHMVQHVLLLTVAPPLLVLGRPWPRMWLPFPAGARKATVRGLARGTWSAPLRLAARVLTRPPVAVGSLAVVISAWHLPAAYDAAVADEWVHVGEHASFLAAALLFWAPMLDAPPVRARIDYARRAAWFVLAGLPGWVLAIVLAYAHHPFYAAYASLDHRPFGLSAMGDQGLAAGIMWVPGSIAYGVAFLVSVYRWLEPGRERPAPAPRPEELSWT